MLPLKPGLFPLPRLRCLLFLQAAFHSGFNSLQTLPNGFFTWGPRARSPLPRNFTPPSDTTKGDPFPTLPPLPLVLLRLHPGHGGGRGLDPSWWDWQMCWWFMELDVGTGDTLLPAHRPPEPGHLVTVTPGEGHRSARVTRPLVPGH